MKPLAFAAGVLLLSATAQAIDLASLPPNKWVDVTPKYVGAPDGGQLFPMGWNNKGTYDPTTKRTITMDRWYDKIRVDTIYANAALAYDPMTNICTVLKLSNWKKEGTPSGGYKTVEMPANAQDPTPLDRHPLGGLALASDSNGLYFENGLNQTGPNGHPNDTWKLDLASNKWSKVTSKSHPPNVTCDVMAYDVKNKTIVLFSTAGGHTTTWLLDPAKGEWKSAPIDGSSKGIMGQGAGICYDSKRGQVVIFGGGHQFDSSSGSLSAYTTTTNKWTHLKECPTAANAPGFDYDSKNDVFLADILGATWAYNPAGDAWTQLSKDGLPESTWKSITYNAAYDVFVYQGGTWDKPAWKLFRYNPASALAAANGQKPANH